MSGITCVADITTTGAGPYGGPEAWLAAWSIARWASWISAVPITPCAAENDIMHWSQEVDLDFLHLDHRARSHLHVPLPPCSAGSELRHARLFRSCRCTLAGSCEEYYFVKWPSSFCARRVGLAAASLRSCLGSLQAFPVRYALNWGAESPTCLPSTACTDEEDVKKLMSTTWPSPCARAVTRSSEGVVPVDESARLRVGIGTDFLPPPTRLTCFEMRLGMLIQRAVNVGALDSESMLEMATIGGARALKPDDEIGHA